MQTNIGLVNSMVEMYNYSKFKTITQYSVNTEYSSKFFVNTQLSIWSSPLGPFILNLNCHYSQLLVCVSSLVCYPLCARWLLFQWSLFFALFDRENVASLIVMDWCALIENWCSGDVYLMLMCWTFCWINVGKQCVRICVSVMANDKYCGCFLTIQIP